MMTREEILSELERLQPWFHRIDLGGGIFTKTESVMGEPVDHPAGPWEVIGKCIPADLAGKSVLDVGCNAGFYAIEAKRRGAARVLGVDGQRQHVRQAVFVRGALGLDIEYRRMNVYELNRRTVGQFGITLALGLVYHLKHLARRARAVPPPAARTCAITSWPRSRSSKAPRAAALRKS
ncbi:MAG: DUF1698 domain-containing protein [Acidobacteria bacterium]|nr:DUF1698 domain-containing protein [Acidobacteriota bacterium]